MSWGMCESGSNNIHFDFPAIMADGRTYTSWQPGSKISSDIKEQAGITTNWQYRQYMQNNADTIIRYNQLASCDDCCSCPARYGAETETEKKNKSNTPFLYKSCIDKSQPFGYNNSDLKSQYLTKYQLQCRMFTPVMSQEQLLKAGYKNYN